MRNQDKAKLEKAAQDMETLNEGERIQFSIAVSLHRIADMIDKIYEDGITVQGT
jgi:hypothetical protein